MADAGAIEHHVRQLTRYGPRHADDPVAVAAALDHVTRTLVAHGYAVDREVYGPDRADVNLLATRAGTGDGPLLEVGAHWDTVPTSPGADDNASAVAGLLEVARLVAQAPPQARGVRFCVFGGEDGDRPATACVGSRAHVAALAGGVEGAIVLEMIGYRDAAPGSQRLPADLAAAVPPPVPDRGDFVALLADPGGARYAELLAVAARGREPAVPVLCLVVPAHLGGSAARSDHVAYWEAGLPAVMVSDTAEFRNPHYHTAGDLPETLDYAFAAQVTQLVADAVLAPPPV